MQNENVGPLTKGARKKLLLKVLKYKGFPFPCYLNLAWCSICCLILNSLECGDTCGTRALHFLTRFCVKPTSCLVSLPSLPGCISDWHLPFPWWIAIPKGIANSFQDALGTWVRSGRETHPPVSPAEGGMVPSP